MSFIGLFPHLPDALGHLEKINKRHPREVCEVFSAFGGRCWSIVRKFISQVSNVTSPVIEFLVKYAFGMKFFKPSAKHSFEVWKHSLGGYINRFSIGHSSRFKFSSGAAVLGLEKNTLHIFGNKLWGDGYWTLRDYHNIRNEICYIIITIHPLRKLRAFGVSVRPFAQCFCAPLTFSTANCNTQCTYGLRNSGPQYIKSHPITHAMRAI